MSLPIGAPDLIAMRRNGKRPAAPVIVSLCGRRDEAGNVQVVATQPDHDWRFLAGLDVFVYVDGPNEAVPRVLRSLAAPCEYIGLWDITARRGMDLWPVWAGTGREFHYLPLEHRKRAKFLRWQKLTWRPGWNRLHEGAV